MEHFKISKLLNNSNVSKFVTRKWNEKINDLSGSQYSLNKNIRFKTLMLRSDLCGYSDAYIVVKGIIDFGVDWNNDMTQKSVAFTNNAPFGSCISKIINTFIDNAESSYCYTNV